MNIIIHIISFTTLFFVGAAMTFAQNIAVVSENGNIITCQTLQEAIEKASSGSIIYLPGGGFQINDDVKITKKLSIIGLGYKANSNNKDEWTTIAGNLSFYENSSSSSVMGCYISGSINIGSSVNDVVVKYCNLDNIRVGDNCYETVVSHNYIRNYSYFSNSRGTLFTNNIASSVYCECAKIFNNIFVNGSTFKNCYITKNVFINGQSFSYSDNNVSYDNLAKSDVGDYPVNIGDLEWADLFVKYNNATISPASDFHFAEDYKTLYKEYGVYGGGGFIDQPPMPFIQAKSIPDQTDTSGNLTIKIRVNSGEKSSNP